MKSVSEVESQLVPVNEYKSVNLEKIATKLRLNQEMDVTRLKGEDDSPVLRDYPWYEAKKPLPNGSVVWVWGLKGYFKVVIRKKSS